MDIKGQQVEHKEDKWQIQLSVSEVVFEVIALVFERVEGFVFDFPTSPSAFDQIDDIVAVNMDIGHPAVFVGDFVVFWDNLKLEKIDIIGIPCAV